jgi:membrane fusion protein (multidrug efflux system)
MATAPRKRFLRHVVVVLGLVALIGGLVAIKGSQIGMLIGMGEAMQKAGPPPEVVSTLLAQRQTWEETLSAVGSVVSAKGVAVANDSAGIVSRLHFESGDTVKRGEILVELDTSVERAQLASLRARRELAEISLNRSKTLVTSGAVAQSQVDTDESQFKSQSADANALSAQIERKIVRAPFSGKLGMRNVNVGQYLAPGTQLTTLESAESTLVEFSLPQQDLALLQLGMKVRALDSADNKLISEGTLSALDPSINPLTRNIKVRATLPDNVQALRPGLFLRVEVVLPKKLEVVAVPLTAIVRASYGDSVFIAEQKPGPDGTPRKVAQQAFVKLDGTQEVVTAGAFKLRNGIPLTVKNEGGPTPSLAPTPENR